MSNILEEKKNRLRTDAVSEQPSKTDSTDKNELEEPKLVADTPQLEKSLGIEREKSEDYLRRLQYLQADFENYRKRMEREVSEVRKYGNERLLADLLVVKDELELAYTKARENKQNPVLLEGVGMVLKRLQGLLSKEGVEKIPGSGTMFNPEVHEAALRVFSDEEDGTIVEEIRPGYLLKGKVLRPSIVKVAEKQSSKETESIEAGEEE
ncbi:MAG TPA: nucleotide exchange factor GrpE [Candidatus Bathyarchaeia archaeon]|nr:nucleotide exchange factor GrpE [Candidatus Bathyarchaeia archaeon]